MHFQSSVNDWPSAFTGKKLLVKAVDRADILREAKQIATNTGGEVYTVLRHFIGNNYAWGGNWETNVQRAREFFRTFIDGTFDEQYACHVDCIEGWNEYLAGSQSAEEVNERVMWARASAWVWLNEYRTQDKYRHIRYAICNTAVGNDMDRCFAEIALEYDCLLGYHPYTHWVDGQRDPGDWPWLSGRFDTMETSWGLKPDWLFSEAGPYEGSHTGWKSPHCLNGDWGLYDRAMREWLADVRGTAAFREGRIAGIAVFSIRQTPDEFETYHLFQPELTALADLIHNEFSVCLPEPAPEPPPPEPLPDYCQGIDVSRYQGVIDWEQVAASGVKFAAIRATVGDYYTDPTFAANWAGAKAAGLLVTAYHVVKPGCDINGQMDLLNEATGGLQFDLPPVLDVELHDDSLPTMVGFTVRGCVDLLMERYPVRPIIYTARWFWNDYVRPLDLASDCPLWVASYSDTATEPYMPTGWDDWAWTFWQYNNEGVVPGIVGDCDQNRFNGSCADFEEWRTSQLIEPELDPPDEPDPPTVKPPFIPEPAEPGPVVTRPIQIGETVRPSVFQVNLRSVPGFDSNYFPVGDDVGDLTGGPVTVLNTTPDGDWLYVGAWVAAEYVERDK